MSNGLDRGFSDHEDRFIKKHAPLGTPASEIARLLGTGRSRSSIIARAARIKAEFKNSPKNPVNAARAEERRKELKVARAPRRLNARPAPRPRRPGAFIIAKIDPSKVAAPTPVKIHVKIGGRPPSLLHELPANGCKFPVTRHVTSGEWLLCSDPRHASSPYCKEHHDMCYNPPKPRRHAA